MDEKTTPTPETEIKVSLAKVLKIKNRLAGRLAQLQGEIQAYNSIVEGTESPNVRELYDKHQRMTDALIKLKVTLDEGNRGGQRERILTLAEKKGKLAWFKSLNTRHGDQQGYNNTVIKYVATIRKSEVDETARKLEREIDELQDQIDAFNASKKVSVDAEVLAFVS